MSKFFYDRKKTFSIRKLTVGVVSLCIGTSLLLGQQVLAADTLVTSPTKDIHFEYVLETELSKDERQLIQSSLPAELTETATYFVVYRPAKTGLPRTGDGVVSGLMAATAGFIVLAVLATENKKARILSMLYITATGLALPLLEVSAVESHALAAYNQTVTIRPGDSLPDGKLRLDGYEFVGYLVEEKPEVKSQARDEKTSMSTSTQLEESKANQETEEADQPVSTGEISDKSDQLIQTESNQTSTVQDQSSQSIVEESGKTEQTGKTEESQNQPNLPTESPVEETSPRLEVEKEVPETDQSTDAVPAQPTEAPVEEKLITTIPAQAPSHLLPTIDFQVQDKVEETALEIPEEQIETNQLPIGQRQVEEGQAGSLRISYQEVLVDGQVVARNEIGREEIPSIPRKVYIGTGQVVEDEVTETNSPEETVQPTEVPVEEKLITTIPAQAPSQLLPTIDFQVQDKVEETALEIPEEQIETNQLPLGQSRVEEGQAGSLRISYQEVLVDGQVVARNEIGREEIPSIPRKVYIGTGQVVEDEVTETNSPEETVQPTEVPVEEKLITTIPAQAPSHLLPTIDFQVQDRLEETTLGIPEERLETDELAVGQSRVEEGQAGSLRIAYQEVLVDGQVIARKETGREEIPSTPKRTYIGTRRDEKAVAPLKRQLPTATIRTQEEEIAFERKEVSRDDWSLGRVEVVAGKKGKQLHTYAVIDGVETLLKTEVLEQAQAEVTYKGVKISETTTEEVTIDFTERVISDPEQYSDYRQIEIAGEQGLKRLHKENGQVVDEEIIKPAKEQVVRIGTKPIEGQVEKESLRTIDFTRRYESNDQLEYGQTRTKQTGQSGQEKVISTYQTIKGVEGQLLSSRTELMKQVQDEIIEVGTKPQIRIEQEEPVTEYVPAPDKERDVQTVLQEGHAKETTYRTVYNLDTISGQVMPIHLPGTVSHPGQVRRISVGTKPTVTKKALPFTEETIPNSTLYLGERVIVRPGRVGEQITTIHYSLNPRTGQTSAGQPQIQEIAAVTQVVQVGTKAVDRTEETVDSRVIAFKTEYRADPTLPYPQREELQAGSDGVERITTTRRYVRDQEVGEPTRVSEVIKAAQNRIIRVGTQPAVRRVETDFIRVYEADPNRPLNERHVKQAGIKQETTYTKNYVLNTEIGAVTEQVETSKVTRTARQEIVQVGTRPTTESVSRTLPTRYEADITRVHGQRYTRQQGRPEITTFTTSYSLDPRTGVTHAHRDNGHVTDSGQAQIVQVGTMPTVRRVETDFTRVYEADSNRRLNEQHIKQVGIKQETTYTKNYVLNTETGAVTEQAETSQITRPGRQETVQVGTRPTTETTSRILATRYEADITRAHGQQHTRQQGRPEITTFTTSYSVNPSTGATQAHRDSGQVTDRGQAQIVQVGTQPVERTEQVVLQELRRPNANLAKDTENVIHEGSPTIRVYRTSYTVDSVSGQITTLPEVLVSETVGRAREVEIGTKEPEQPVTPPAENEESCPIIPDNTEGGTCEAPTEPTDKPSTTDLECILNPTDQCWPEEEEKVDAATVTQLRAKMEELMSYRSRFRNPSWHTYIDAVYNESEKIIQSGVAADIRTQLDVIDADLDFVIDAQIPKISTDANSGASRAENIELITDANGGTAPRYEENPNPVTPNPDQGSGTEQPEPVSPTNPPVTPTPNPEQPTVPDTPPVTPVPEPDQPNTTEKEPVSPEKPEETTEETVEDVNKPLLRVRDNKNHYQLFTKERSTKVFYALENKQENFNKGTSKLYVNDELIKTVDFTKEKLEARFGNLLPNVDYRIETEMEYRASDGTVKTAKLEDIVSVDFEERHFEIKNIDEAEVWKRDGDRLVRQVSLFTEVDNLSPYFIKLKSDEYNDILLPVTSLEIERINGERHFKLQAKIINTEERRQKLDKYYDTVTIYLPRQVRENRENKNKYSTFKTLLAAMKANSFGTFELQQDLTASEIILSETDKSYLSSNFYGTLKGNGFTIHDLKVPLFNDLRGTVSDLNLKAVDIHLPKETKVGALAKQSTNGSVTNVHVEGRVVADNFLGGLIGEVDRTSLSKVSFTGSLISLGKDDNKIGGIAGWLGGGKIEKGYVDATISATSSNVKAGGLVGQLENNNTQIASSFATGRIITTKTKDTEVGGLLGAVFGGNNIRIADSIAAVKAVNGHKVYGENQQGDSVFSNIKIVEALSSGEDNPNIGFATSDDVKANVEDRGLIKSHSSLNIFNEKNVFDIDYTKENFNRTDRKQAYENMEKLLPFFTRDVIIQHANRLENDDALVTKKLVDVVPMIDKAPVFDIVQNKDRINRLLLHFEDGTAVYQHIIKKRELGSGAVVEYHLLDKNISYTPENYIRNTDIGSMIFELQTQLGAVRFESEEVNKVLGLPAYQPEKERQLLFLEESFERVKSNISTHLTDLISNYNLVGLDNSAIREYLKSYISKNKVQLLLGLAYMDKWYNIQFDKVNAKDLMMKKADFFGKNVNSLDQLIRIGSMGAEMLKPKNNYALASQVIAKESIGGDLFDYLEGYRKAFAPKMTNNNWFKSATKATIIETPSTIKEVLEKQTNPTKDIYKNGFYDKMASNHWMYKEMALILLAMPSKDIFILTDMANTLIGMYANQTGSIDDIERDIQLTAKEWAGHADYLYNILPEAHKEKMFRRVVTWDNKFTNSTWRSPTDVSPYTLRIPAMKYFYIPLGHKHDYTATGAHADYTIDNIYYFNHNAISVDGARVYTHELTHVADDDTILLGHGKRTSLDYEVYARGLFESITWDNQDRFGINNVYDFSKYDQHNYGRRLTNKTPERFKSTQDLQDYMKGYLDVIYTLDILEAEAVLSLSNPQAKQNWFAQMTTGTRNTSTVNLVNKVPVSLEQLILNGMISRRPYGYGYNSDANAYLEVRAFDPIYGSLNNDGTSRNEYEVRKIAFELLAEYGYENGMVPYLSNQYKDELGEADEFGKIADSRLISKITNARFDSSSQFRIAMFRQRKERINQLKPVQLVASGVQNGEGYFYEPTRMVSASELQNLMKSAVEYDANNNKYSSNGHDVREQSRVYSLKAAVLNGYLRATDDFRESIYLTNP
ncbi:TPA: ZmpA/ZmpB/ZmpC family metallo-endopeptidase [Streptococcus suis]